MTDNNPLASLGSGDGASFDSGFCHGGGDSGMRQPLRYSRCAIQMIGERLAAGRRTGIRLFVVPLLWVFLFASTGAQANPGIGEPYVPENSAVVLQTVPSSTDPRVRAFATLRSELRQHPKDIKLVLKLSKAYVGYGRSTGNERYLGRALGVIEPWMAKQPTPIPIMVVHATILQSRHHFDESRLELKKILERDPGNAQTWLTLATVDMVQGRYEEAAKDCKSTTNYGGEYLGLVCAGELSSLTGHAEKAYRLLQFVAGGGKAVPVDFQAYVQGLLAESAQRLGWTAKAEAHYKEALQLTPGDNFLLANYGDFLLDQNQPEKVIELVKNFTQSDTSFMRLVAAEAALHKPQTQDDIQEMTARFKAMDQRGSHVYRREQARFVLYLEHDPQRALELAEKNWTVQRAPKDIRIYLEAALAAGKPQAAREVVAHVQRWHLQDPHIGPLIQRVNRAMNPIQTGNPQ